MEKSKFILSLTIILLTLYSCTKSDELISENTPSGTSPSVSKTGGLIINLSWSTAQLITACVSMAFVDVEFQGPTSNFSRTYSQSPVRVDERVAIGNYTYTITKRPVNGCSNFSPIIKTGSFTIISRPVLCGTPTNLKFTLD